MDHLDNLSDLFARFPGIGARQARRFAFALLTWDEQSLGTLSTLIRDVKQNVHQCSQCFRYFTNNDHSKSVFCNICSETNRETTTILVIEKDADLDKIEKSGTYHGLYFVLGGTAPVMEKDPSKKIRSRALFDRVQEKAGAKDISEVIVALSATTEGDATTHYILKILHPLALKYGFGVSVLGRGLSTGTEIEYSDSDTLKNALKNRQ